MSQNPQPSSAPPSVPDAPRVILAAWPAVAAPPLRDILLALAAYGHSFVLWLAPGAPPAAADALLDLQLEITHSGGIVLALEDASLQAAAEALGRIDLALALGEAEADALARAAAQLERDRRPDRLLLLRPDEPAGALRSLAALTPPQADLPAGIKLFELGIKELAPGELAGRISEWCSMRIKA